MDQMCSFAGVMTTGVEKSSANFSGVSNKAPVARQQVRREFHGFPLSVISRGRYPWDPTIPAEPARPAGVAVARDEGWVKSDL
jgi:hypothetical protein